MSASAAAGGAAAPNPAFDSHFASVFSACTSEGLGGDLKFVDAFFSFLRRNTKLLQAPQAVEQVQAIAVKHVEIAKKQAKADATAAAAKKAAEAKQASDKAAAASASAASSASSSSSSAAPASASASVTSLPDAADKPDAEDALPTPIDNGGRTDKYVWTQTLSEVNVSIVLPAGTTSKLLSVSIEPNALHASLKKGDKTVYLSGEPDERIDSNNATWTLETDKAGVKLLQLYLPKLNKMSWWKCVVKGDPCINTKKIVPENSKLEDLDGDTRSTVEKMMFDQRQKQMGKPSSDEITKQNALKRFMEMHPEMDFSNASGLTPSEFVSFKLASRTPHTHNTEVFVFALAHEDAMPNLPVSSCVMTRCKDPAGGADIIRPYTPINTHEAGKLQLLVKRYEAGKMSKHIHGLAVGDSLEIKGPMAKLKYEANKYAEIGMIAGGTGLTPMVQVADVIFRNPDDKTKVVLIVSQSTLGDVLLREKLDSYTAQRGDQFRVIHVITQGKKPEDASAEWVAEWGRLSRATLEKYLPKPASNTFCYTCGPPQFMAAISGDKQPDKTQGPLVGMLKEMGWEADHVCKQ